MKSLKSTVDQLQKALAKLTAAIRVQSDGAVRIQQNLIVGGTCIVNGACTVNSDCTVNGSSTVNGSHSVLDLSVHGEVTTDLTLNGSDIYLNP